MPHLLLLNCNIGLLDLCFRDVVLALLAAKASVTEVDSKGCTPLHLAAWNGHADICDVLLQSASDKSIVNVQVVYSSLILFSVSKRRGSGTS